MYEHHLLSDLAHERISDQLRDAEHSRLARSARRGTSGHRYAGRSTNAGR